MSKGFSYIVDFYLLRDSHPYHTTSCPDLIDVIDYLNSSYQKIGPDIRINIRETAIWRK